MCPTPLTLPSDPPFQVASKASLAEGGEVTHACNEVHLLRSDAARHPFVVALCGTFQTPDAVVTMFQVRLYIAI